MSVFLLFKTSCIKKAQLPFHFFFNDEYNRGNYFVCNFFSVVEIL